MRRASRLPVGGAVAAVAAVARANPTLCVLDLGKCGLYEKEALALAPGPHPCLDKGLEFRYETRPLNPGSKQPGNWV